MDNVSKRAGIEAKFGGLSVFVTLNACLIVEREREREREREKREKREKREERRLSLIMFESSVPPQHGLPRCSRQLASPSAVLGLAVNNAVTEYVPTPLIKPN